LRQLISCAETGDIKNLWEAIKAIPPPYEKSEKEEKPPSVVVAESEQETEDQATKIDFSLLDEMYAGKRAPDLTIVRIEELEK
jgi:hypothetical protein